MAVQSVEHGLALIALDELTSDEIPHLALLLVEDGCDSPAVAALASGTRCDDPVEIRTDLLAALGSAGHRIPSKGDAARVVVRICAGQAVTGKRPPRDAAREIIWTYQEIAHELPKRSSILGEDFGIAGLIGAYYAYDDVPMPDDKVKQELDAELLAELRKLAAASGA